MKNYLKIRKELLILFLSFFLASCLTNVDEEVDVQEPITEVTFSLDVKPIIDNNCTQCHSTAGGTPPNLETYGGVSANAASIKAEVESKRMPIGGSLTDAEIQAIISWVDQGAQNN